MMDNVVGFVGLGRMGVPMVRNLLEAGIEVRGFDQNPQAGTDLDKDAKFTRVGAVADAARGVGSLILMLPDSRIVDVVLWGQGGLAGVLEPDIVVIDMSSSDPVHSRTNGERLEAAGIGFLDAPVSGGVSKATDGALSIMVGGDAERFAAAKPIFDALGRTTIHVGAAGAGHAVKALNNYVSAAGLIAVSEALVAAEAFGIDPALVNDVFNASTGRNNTTEVKVAKFMLSGRYDSGFALALMRKDVQTAMAFIEGMGTPGKLAKECLAVTRQVEAALGNGADHTAVHASFAKRPPFPR